MAGKMIGPNERPKRMAKQWKHDLHVRVLFMRTMIGE